MTVLSTLLLIWSILTAAFVALILYRGHLTRREVDGVFLNENVDHDLEIEHDEIVRRVTLVDPFVKTAGGAAALLTIAVIGVYVAQILPTVRFQ